MSRRKQSRVYINATCSSCGVVRKVRKDSPKATCNSCYRKNARGKNAYNWKGYEGLSGSTFNSVKSAAKKRGIEFNLTIEEAWHKYIGQDRKCYYSGINLIIKSNPTRADGNASIDRVDSSKGYTLDNIVWCHKDINYMKGSKTVDEFINIIRKINTHWSAE